MILTLDLATKTGWAVLDGRRIVASGTWDFPRKTVRKVEEDAFQKLPRFRQKLDELKTQFPALRRFVWEEVEFAEHLLAYATNQRMLTVAILWALENRMTYQGIPVGVHKKHSTGNGAATKELTIEAVVRRFGRVPGDDNEADALSLAAAVIDGLDMSEPERKRQRKLAKAAERLPRMSPTQKKAAKAAAIKIASLL